MNPLEQIEAENQNLINKITELAQTEDSRASIISAVFIRTNDELRLNNMKEIREDIRLRSKKFRTASRKICYK